MMDRVLIGNTLLQIAEMMRELLEDGNDIRLGIIAGNDARADLCMKAARRMGIEDRVFVLTEEEYAQDNPFIFPRPATFEDYLDGQAGIPTVGRDEYDEI